MTITVDDLVARVRELEEVERELKQRKIKRAVVQKRYREKHKDKIKIKKAEYYQSHKEEYALAARRRRLRNATTA